MESSRDPRGGRSAQRPSRGPQPAKAHHPLLFAVVESGPFPRSPKPFACNVVRGVKGAVGRNRIKRRLREIYRALAPRLISDIRLLVMAKPPAARATFVQLEEAFFSVVRRLRLLKSPAFGTMSPHERP